MPARRASSRRAAASRGELLGRRGAGRVGGHADAAGGVGRAGHPRGELVAAVAREHEVRVRVDEARDHAPPSASMRSSAARPRARRRDEAVLDHQRGVADEAERALAERLVVGDEQPDVVDDDGSAVAASAQSRAARTSNAVWRRRGRSIAADHDVADVGGGRGEHRARRGVLGLDAAPGARSRARA
jgi:hypothetical protein